MLLCLKKFFLKIYLRKTEQSWNVLTSGQTDPPLFLSIVAVAADAVVATVAGLAILAATVGKKPCLWQN